jgi:hypothetical protein
MAFQPLLVAAQALLDPLGGLIEAAIGVLGRARGFERHAGGQVEHAIGPEARSVPGDGHMAGIAAVEIFRQGARHAVEDLGPEGFADIEILTGYPQRHATLPFRALSSRPSLYWMTPVRS